jgi:hypothetical protein
MNGCHFYNNLSINYIHYIWGSAANDANLRGYVNVMGLDYGVSREWR